MIPYMGSKRGSAGKIYQAIKNMEPDGKILADLFCGGFAISEYFYKQGWQVIANDSNKYVIGLLKKVIIEGLPEKVVTKFISRSKFFDVMNNPDKYEDWYVGYVQCCWSFGNNQKTYLFGKDTEPSKKAGHELVINKNPELIKKLIPNIPQKYIDGILKQDNWHKRRMALNMVSRKLKTRIYELEQLQQLQRLEQLQQLERLQRLQQLEQLERLQQLERLERLERLELSSKDYRKVKIPKGAIIYCDIPYNGTAEYKQDSFNHVEFWQWVRNKSKTNKVYISEYNAPDDFKRILSFGRNSSLHGGYNKNQPDECLFTMARAGA